MKKVRIIAQSNLLSIDRTVDNTEAEASLSEIWAAHMEDVASYLSGATWGQIPFYPGTLSVNTSVVQ